MKKLIAVLGLVVVATAAHGQGSIFFNNVGGGLNAPVSQFDGTLVPAGTGFTAELLAGADASSLAPVAGATTGFVAPGYFTGGEKVLAGLAPGSSPFFEVRVWETLGGTITSYAAAQAAGAQFGSVSFQLADGFALGNPAGQPPTLGPVLQGMTAFALVPEPTTYALLALGAAALFLRRRK